MARPGWPERNRAARSFRQLRRFHHVINSDKVFGTHTAFKAYLAPLHRTKWFVYSKRPFAGPEQVLAYLSRYTHRVAISNSRLIAADATGVTFSYKDYRIEGPARYKTMTLKPDEFIRRFLIHVLSNGFHRIRHYGLLASCRTKAATLARARELIAATTPAAKMQCNDEAAASMEQPTHPCPCCGSRMVIIETFAEPEPVQHLAAARIPRPLMLRARPDHRIPNGVGGVELVALAQQTHA